MDTGRPLTAFGLLEKAEGYLPGRSAAEEDCGRGLEAGLDYFTAGGGVGGDTGLLSSELCVAGAGA